MTPTELSDLFRESLDARLPSSLADDAVQECWAESLERGIDPQLPHRCSQRVLSDHRPIGRGMDPDLRAAALAPRCGDWDDRLEAILHAVPPELQDTVRAVVDSPSIREASRRLGVSHSTVLDRLSRLVD